MKRLEKIVFAAVIVVLSITWAYALTPEQVIQLKKAGVSDETIRTMIAQEQADKARNPADQIGVREVKDAEGNASVVYSTGAPTQNDSEKEKVDKAWNMLQNQSVIIDRDRRR
jgi:hypothetical protein